MKTAKRSFVSLLTALSFLVLAVTGILAFIRPFSIQIIGLHAMIGFVFIALIGLHIANNSGHLKRYFRSKTLWITVAISTGLTALFAWQPAPVRSILGLSKNLGPALERFEVTSDGLTFNYSPASHYKMELRVKTGPAFDPKNPPAVAIWLENASFYHIKPSTNQPPQIGPSFLIGISKFAAGKRQNVMRRNPEKISLMNWASTRSPPPPKTVPSILPITFYPLPLRINRCHTDCLLKSTNQTMVSRH